jgi:pseudouridine-5'-phosphate glycosidase
MSIVLSPEVADALGRGAPVVALESTIICHGIPRPENAILALELEAAVRGGGSVPATTAVLDGVARIGLDTRELTDLAARDEVLKCTTRDLSRACAGGQPGATTVAATLFLAASAGIPVMATGGIGGVHRGGETSLDVSADLDEMARRHCVVVASGIKTILDLPRTMERLETLGVAVAGFGTAELPGFYTAETGIEVPRIDTVAEVAAQFIIQRRLGVPGTLLIARPPPPELALPRDQLESMIEEARQAAREAGMAGPAETPFLLRHLAMVSAGRTVALNSALAIANARLAGEVAAAIAAAHAA